MKNKTPATTLTTLNDGGSPGAGADVTREEEQVP